MNPMNPMGLAPFNSDPPPWGPPPLPALPPPTTSFWIAANVTSRLKELYDTLNLAKAMQKELEMLSQMKERERTTKDEGKGGSYMSMDRFTMFMKDNQIELEFQESMSLDTANAIMSKLRFQLEPFRVVTDGNTQWEEKSAVKRLADKMEKYKRNKLWRRRKRRRIAENVAREHEQFDKINKEADEWRAREIAKDAAQQKSYSNENGKCQQPLERVGVTSNVEKFKSHIKNTEHFQSQAEDRANLIISFGFQLGSSAPVASISACRYDGLLRYYVLVEKMKEIAKLKAKEEKRRLGSELEQVLIYLVASCCQPSRRLYSIYEKGTKPPRFASHFLPEEDDKFLERVRAAVEEEERQTVAAADTDAARDAIANAEESSKHIQSRAVDSEKTDLNDGGDREKQDQTNETADEGASKVVAQECNKQDTNRPASSSVYDSVANLPMQFYHYYHGSGTDMGTL
ncbi:hypothetical protein OROHE_001060, partial [Orobanche hederae]